MYLGQISKAVEMEVAKRLEEREREREREKDKEEELQHSKEDDRPVRQKSKSPKKEQTLPSGLLTPLLKRHKDLDDELKTRLQDLEKRLWVTLLFMIGSDTDAYSAIAGVKRSSLLTFSLLRRKRRQDELMSHLRVRIPRSTSSTWCCLLRLISLDGRGDLQVALDLYRKAESYVPDNIKLKERWILFVVHVFLYNIGKHDL
jgi:kinesin family protein 22